MSPRYEDTYPSRVSPLRYIIVGAVGIVFLLMIITTFSCVSYTTIEPGNVGIVVNRSGDNRGVQSVAVRTGRVWYNPWNTTIIEYPTFMQNAVWTKSATEGNPSNEELTFTTADQMTVSGDFSIAYKVLETDVPKFYVQFRSPDISHFTHGYLHNVARDSVNEVAGRYHIEAIMGDNAAFLKEARERIQSKVKDYGVFIDSFGLIGSPRPPPQVSESINLKVKASQIATQMENEVKQVQAQAAKNIAEAEGRAKSAEADARATVAKAQGNAEANKLLAASLSAPLLEWQRIQAQQQAIARWKGEVPTHVLGSGAVPFVNLDKEK